MHHGDPRTLSQVFFGEMWRGRDNVRVSLRRPWSARTLVSAMLPVLSLAAGALVLVGLAMRTQSGAALAAAAGAFLLGLVAMRARVMLSRGRSGRRRPDPSSGPRGLEWMQALAVASAYESGRALAVAARVGYRRRRVAS